MMGTSFFFGGGLQVLIVLMFILVFGLILITIVRSIGQWNSNNRSPRLTVDAAVVSKRMHITRHTGANGAAPTSSTRYYVTFEVSSGERMELPVQGREYGLLAEGDAGRLTFQGTRYLDFERQ